jgi:peptide chain release factor 2
MTAPGFWNDPRLAKEVSRRRARLEEPLKRLAGLDADLEEAEIMVQLAEEEDDAEAGREAAGQVDRLTDRLTKEEMARLLAGPNDAGSAILSINAGAGGTEACDWAEMILRMYRRWAEVHSYKSEIVEINPGDEAGIKSATLTISGENAFGYLKAEVGIHRLVRISPFDASGRRHTSFASVFVYPDVEDEIDIVIEDKDLRIDTYRASGHGGQHVNKTDSAVRITHFPSGLVVQSQNERSQHRNKDMAMRVLKARLYEYELAKRQEEKDKLNATKKDIAWGSQIRSYVLQPYRLVKDHRTQVEKGDVDSVLDGDLDVFIQAYLVKMAAEGQ